MVPFQFLGLLNYFYEFNQSTENEFVIMQTMTLLLQSLELLHLLVILHWNYKENKIHHKHSS